MIDVLGVHVCGVAVAVLSLDSKLNRLIDVVHTNDGKDGHHQLLLHEEVVKARFTNNATDLRTYRNTDLSEKHGCVSSDAIARDGLLDDARLGIFRIHEYDACERFCPLRS